MDVNERERVRVRKETRQRDGVLGIVTEQGHS